MEGIATLELAVTEEEGEKASKTDDDECCSCCAVAGVPLVDKFDGGFAVEWEFAAVVRDDEVAACSAVDP